MSAYVKDGINAYSVDGRANAVNPDHVGTKAAAEYPLEIEGGGSSSIRLHLAALGSRAAESEFDHVFEQRQQESDAFYDVALPSVLDEDERRVARQAFGGLLWTKQYYAFDVSRWLTEHGVNPVGANGRASSVRNAQWPHLGPEPVPRACWRPAVMTRAPVSCRGRPAVRIRC